MTSTSPPLTTAFVEGWRSLPTELKLDVLSHVLPRKITLDFLCDYLRQGIPSGVQVTWRKSWTWAFINIPEFNGLALDSLVLHKVFTFCCWTLTRKFPSIDISNRIRHVEVTLIPCSGRWEWFTRLAQGTMGFRHLRSVHLIVDAIGSTAFSLNDFIASVKRAGPVVLDTKRLNITYRRRSDNWGGQMQLAALKELMNTHLTAREASDLQSV